MKPPNQSSRINLVELKAQMTKKLGPECSKQYFDYLHKFLSSKLNKLDFNKLCLRILGRENIKLHNNLIRSILRNSCGAKISSPGSESNDALGHVTQVVKENPADVHHKNGLHSSFNQVTSLNGTEMLPVSPRKARTCPRDRRTADRCSALAPNVKSKFLPHLNNISQLSDCGVIMEYRDLCSLNVGRSMQHLEGPIQQTNNEHETLISCTFELPVKSMLVDDPATAYLKGQQEVSEKSRRDPSFVRPLQVPLLPKSSDGVQKALPPARSRRFIGNFNDGTLLDTIALRERMGHVAQGQGLEGVSLECASVLNLGLDLYMKEVIRSCLGLVGSNSGNETNLHMKLNNSMNLVLEVQKVCPQICLQDIRVAMSLRPPCLGENWPLLLEKICTHSFEE